MVNRPLSNGNANGSSHQYKPDDLESAISSSRRTLRFRDVVNLAVQDKFHAELKRKLKDGVDRDALEKYRKSQHDLEQMKNKKIRAFYEQQNETLNDWLEVDALVMSMADDVLDSMNPQDVRISLQIISNYQRPTLVCRSLTRVGRWRRRRGTWRRFETYRR